MSRRWCFEAMPRGKEQCISVKRSCTHRHHRHYHRHYDPDVYRVGREEWNCLVERKRYLTETNKSLATEASALKASLSAAQADAHHASHVVVAQLQNHINVLSADNDALRLSVDKAGNTAAKQSREEERIFQIIEKLEKEKIRAEQARPELEKEIACLHKENASLRERIRCYSKQDGQRCSGRASDAPRDSDYTYWKEQCLYWKSRFEDTRRRHDDMCGLLEIRTEKMRAYEEILKRRQII